MIDRYCFERSLNISYPGLCLKNLIVHGDHCYNFWRHLLFPMVILFSKWEKNLILHWIWSFIELLGWSIFKIIESCILSSLPVYFSILDIIILDKNSLHIFRALCLLLMSLLGPSLGQVGLWGECFWGPNRR